ncbi:TolB family protein [Nitrospirota bacterium]
MRTGKHVFLAFLLSVTAIGLLMAGCGGGSSDSIIISSVSLPSTITLVSVNSVDGTQGNMGAFNADISTSGRYVVFDSRSYALVEGDTNDDYDVFVCDMHTGTVKLISNAADGTEGESTGEYPSISGDGRYVAFHSTSENIVAGDNNVSPDVFLRDLMTDTVTLLSINAADSSQGDSTSENPTISTDGKFVAFESQAQNLIPGQPTNGNKHILLRNVLSGEITMVSNSATGDEGDVGSYEPALSGNGRYVAFYSEATNLVSVDSGGFADIFLKDMQTGAIKLISNAADGTQGDGHSQYPAISDDGRYVAFVSTATNLVPGDSNGQPDVFLRDLQADTIKLISNSSDGTPSGNYSYQPSISADGRYVTFGSSGELITGDNNSCDDIYLRDTLTDEVTLLSVNASGVQASDYSYIPIISGNGKYVVFESDAENLVETDSNGNSDIFFVPR